MCFFFVKQFMLLFKWRPTQMLCGLEQQRRGQCGTYPEIMMTEINPSELSLTKKCHIHQK